jgi:hypothetical protein
MPLVAPGRLQHTKIRSFDALDELFTEASDFSIQVEARMSTEGSAKSE